MCSENLGDLMVAIVIGRWFTPVCHTTDCNYSASIPTNTNVSWVNWIQA